MRLGGWTLTWLDRRVLDQVLHVRDLMPEERGGASSCLRRSRLRGVGRSLRPARRRAHAALLEDAPASALPIALAGLVAVHLLCSLHDSLHSRTAYLKNTTYAVPTNGTSPRAE